MRLGELTYLTDQIVTFGFSSLELRNKAVPMSRSGYGCYV
ncbi:hypothetical protein VCSRO130_3643 [Vibrio cholerae]|nr:hypothetical protein VCSRO130_3643 [Vibrio cholerae]